MRVLLINPRHPQTFFSFEKALRTLHKKAVMPPLGLLTVAALLPQDWTLTLVDQNCREISPQDWENCDLVLISGMVVQHRGILEAIREGKRQGKTVVVGGPWVFHCPEEVMAAGADLVVKGEGETAIARLLESLARHESGLVIAADGPAPMETSPTPRYDLLDLDQYVDMIVQFSRGCPFKCEFCDITLMFGHRFRTKTPAQILQELQTLYDLGWRGTIFFADDNLIGVPAKTKRLLEELLPWVEARGRPFEFYTQASVNLAGEPELLELMVLTGFTSVFLGIETPDEESLRLSGKTQNVGLDLDRVCQTINRAGLAIQAGCIIGFDQERPGADQRLLNFAIRNQIPEMFITLLQVGAGTEMWHRLDREGRLLEGEVDYEHLSNQTGLINFVPTRPLEQIVEEFIHLYEVLYEPKFFLERTQAHFLRMRPLPFTMPFRFPPFSELRGVAAMLFRQGVLAPTRWTYWKTFLSVIRHHPPRLRQLLSHSFKMEHYADFRRTIAIELRRQLAQRV